MTTTIVPFTSREEWLAARRRGVGASDAAAVMGLKPEGSGAPPFKTALEIYLDKIGLLPDDPKPKPRLQWGLRFEPVLRAAYTEFTGRELAKPTGIYVNPDAPWMLATLDFESESGPVEVKRVSSYAGKFFGESGSDQIPKAYSLQCQQQMACVGADTAELAALIGDDDFRIFTIRRNAEIIDVLVEAEREFMERVQSQNPPLPDFEHPTTADLLAMIEPERRKSIDLGADVAALADDYAALGTVESVTKAKRKELKARLLHAMGTAEFATLPDGRSMRRKLIEKCAYAVSASSYFDFRINNPK